MKCVQIHVVRRKIKKTNHFSHFSVLKRPVPWDCCKVIIFPFSHFHISACVLTAVSTSGNTVVCSLQFYRVKMPFSLGAILPSENAVFTNCFHCSFTEWKCRFFSLQLYRVKTQSLFIAVWPSGNDVAFWLQIHWAQKLLRFDCSLTEC